MSKIKTASLVAANLFSLSFLNAKEAAKPNIVVILCDDLGYGDLSCYGHPVIKTPNLDKLASNGIRLTDFYSAAPVSSPSRAGLLTGRSPNKAGVYDFIIGGNTKRDDKKNLVHLQPYEQTIPAQLKTVGYETCLVGKWHISSYFNSDKQPKPDAFGFDYWFSTHNNAAPSHENPKNFVRNGKDVGEIKGFSCQIVANEAMSWLSKKDAKTPFFLEVCFHEPHAPIASPQDLTQSYLPYSLNAKEAEYFANVANMDNAVGRLIEYLNKNVKGETLIIFTSDNGPETLDRYEKADKSYGSRGGLRGHKLWTNEAGFRVPCIVSWLGSTSAGITSDAVTSSLDFMPTFCEMTGAKLPKNKLDGVSITNLIKTGEFNRKKPLIWAFYNAVNDQVVAMRSGDWKIMASLKNNGEVLPKIENLYDGNEVLVKESQLCDFVLYNMKTDRNETTDVAQQNPAEFNKMKKQLDKEYAKLLKESFIWR